MTMMTRRENGMDSAKTIERRRRLRRVRHCFVMAGDTYLNLARYSARSPGGAREAVRFAMLASDAYMKGELSQMARAAWRWARMVHLRHGRNVWGAAK